MSGQFHTQPGAHHLTPESIAATIKDLREIEDGTTQFPVDGRDWRTWAGVLALTIEYLVRRAAHADSIQLAAKGQGEPAAWMVDRELFISRDAIPWRLLPPLGNPIPLYLATPASAQPDRGAAQEMTCPQCGVDRLQKPCPGMADECAMIGDAHLLASPASQTVAPEALGICCYGGPLKPKSACASCAAWQHSAAAVAPTQAFPNDGREPDWAEYAAAEAAHAQQEAAPKWEARQTIFDGGEILVGGKVIGCPKYHDALRIVALHNTTVPDHSERGAVNAVDRGPWRYNCEDGKHFVESADFAHDVRLYINGDFANAENREAYGEMIAQQLNRAPSTIAAGQEAASMRDAARYRWVRSQDTSLETQQRDKGIVNGPSCYHEVEGIRELKWGAALDEAIDAAMTAAPSSEKGGAK